MAQEKKAGLQQSNDGYRAAIEDYKRSIKLDSSKAEALVRIGDCYAALQDYESAQNAYHQGINESPVAKEILTESIAKEKMGACSAAIHAIQKLTGFEPNNAALYYREATLYVKNKQSARANENFRLAAELEPANVTYANAASHPVAAFRRQMTAEEMKDGLIKGAVVVGAAVVGAAVMRDASAAAEDKAQRARVEKIIAESGGRKIKCPKCNGYGKIVDVFQNGNYSTQPVRSGYHGLSRL